MFFWGKKRSRQVGETSWVEALGIDTDDWSQVFSACLGKMTAIQAAFGDEVVGDREWHIDFSRGTIAFGEQAFPIQLIGSESDVSDSWLWGWQNVNGLPENELQLAVRTKALGERLGLEALTEAGFSLDETFNGHNLSVVACGLADRYCYYRCPHANGSVFVALSGVPDSVFSPIDAPGFLSATMHCINSCDIDHKVFVDSFLAWNKTAVERDGLRLSAHFPGGDLEIEFERLDDGRLRIASINADYT